MAHRLLLLAGLVAALVATPALAATADETVVIDDGLRPAFIEIDAGTTVTWRNRDDERHRVRSKDGPVRFDSKNLEAGESFSFTFTVTGEYPYYDHRNRGDAAYFGTVVVGDVTADATLPVELAEVTIVDDAFTTSRVTIVPGGEVTWVNQGADEHTVSANDLAFDSGSIAAGGQFSLAFEQSGEYPYFCQIHPEMRATVIVTAGVPSAESEVVPAEAPASEPEPASPASSVDAPRIGSALDLLATPPPE